ncbi:MAG: hypothetical protein ACR2MM_01450 [Flavobacteriaceae bacterium]
MVEILITKKVFLIGLGEAAKHYFAATGKESLNIGYYRRGEEGDMSISIILLLLFYASNRISTSILPEAEYLYEDRANFDQWHARVNTRETF